VNATTTTSAVSTTTPVPARRQGDGDGTQFTCFTRLYQYKSTNADIWLSQGNGAPAARRQGTQAPAQMTTPAPAGAAAGGASGATSTSTPTNAYKCLQMSTNVSSYYYLLLYMCLRATVYVSS